MRDACWFGAKHDISSPQGRPIRASCQGKKTAKALKASHRTTHTHQHTLAHLHGSLHSSLSDASKGCIQTQKAHYYKDYTLPRPRHPQWAEYQRLAAGTDLNLVVGVLRAPPVPAGCGSYRAGAGLQEVSTWEAAVRGSA